MLVAMWLSLLIQTGNVGARAQVPKELRYERRAIADSENAFKQLELAASQFMEPAGNTNYEKIHAAAGDWIDDTALDQFCEEHAAILELMQQAAQLKFLQYPEIQSPDQSFPYFGKLRALARFGIVEAKRQYAKKNYALCARRLADVVRIGDLMMLGDGTLIHYLVGVNVIKATGLSGVRWFVAKPDVPTTVLLDLNTQIELLDQDRGAMAMAFRVEFHRFVVPMLKRMKDDPVGTLPYIPDEVNNTNDDKAYYEALKKNPKPFDYKASFDLCADFYRELVIAMDAKYSAEAGTRIDRRLHDIGKQVSSLEKAATVPNAAGIMLLAVIVPAFNNIYLRAARTEVTTSCTRLLLALHAYANDHKELPTTLDDLVPKYLKSIPVDAFDGKPLRYSKTEKKVFSVGPEMPIEFAVKF